MVKKSLAIIAVLGLGVSVFADQTYISELQGLLNTLATNDPGKVSLTLKLADAEFEEYLHQTNGNASAADNSIKTLRRKAVRHYEEALTGFGGVFSSLSGNIKGKVQFQLARLYNDEGKTADAERIWTELSEQESMVDLRRESSLRLAENLEQRSDFKKSESYYLKSLKLCSSADVCSYIHYRLGWVYHREDRGAEAVNEVKLALWDSKGQIREEALRDYITFISLMPGDGKESLLTIEDLANKSRRPTLIHELAEAYFAAGNRVAGVYVLQATNKKNPQLRDTARLLEEYYGFRNWPAFNDALEEMNTLAIRPDYKSAPIDVEVEKIMRRLTVQLDGERTTQPGREEEFKKSVVLYLTLFPAGATRPQMIDGWLVAESKPENRIKQLKIWIGEEAAANRGKEEIKLREKRAAEGQKEKAWDVVAEEMSVLKDRDPSESKRREFAYQQARALYEQKKYDQALPLFTQLADVKDLPDKWNVQSQHLALDILGQNKDYDGLLRQANLWLQNPNYNIWVQKSDLANDIKDIKNIALQAQFEGATREGEKPEALKAFNSFCAQNLFVPQSCENARVLAIKLKDEDTLIEILKRQNKNEELLSEYEASAHFEEAAKILEDSFKKHAPSNRDYIKTALLYELGGKMDQRDRLLGILQTKLRNPIGAEEPLIYETLKDAGLLSASSFKLPWSADYKKQLTIYLENSGKGTAETHRALLASCENMGPAWTKAALAQMSELNEKQKTIHFVGKASKRKFEARLAALKKLVSTGDCYLQGGDAKLRVSLATLLGNAEKDLASEILESPMPEGLDDAQKEQVKATLTQMAAPFKEKSLEFEKLASEQIEKIESPQERLAFKEKIDLKKDLTETDLFSAPVALKSTQNVSMEEISSALLGLHKNPNEVGSLEALKQFYEKAGQNRLAAYYQGRLLQAKKDHSGEEKK